MEHSYPSLVPASLTQETRLTHELLSEANKADYSQRHITFGLWFDGNLNITFVKEAIREVIRRHEVLRTAFRAMASAEVVSVEGWNAAIQLVRSTMSPAVTFRQIVCDRWSFEIDTFELDQLDSDSKRRAVRGIVSGMIDRRFDYERPPLLHGAVLKTLPDRHLLILVISHLVFDGWSERVFGRELLELYSAMLGGRRPSLPELSIQFGQFAIWQRQRMKDPRNIEKLSAYCRKSLAGFMPLSSHELSFAKKPTEIQPHVTAGKDSIDLARHDCRSLRTFLKENRLTAYIVLLCAYSITLYHFCQNPRIGLWTFLANRIQPATWNLIGWFANDHLICIDLSDNPEIVRLLDRVRNIVFDSSNHQELNFSMIEQFVSQCKTSVNFPSWRHRFSFEALSSSQERLPWRISETELAGRDLIARRTGVGGPGSRTEFALRIFMSDNGPEKIKLVAQYCTDCFEPSVIQQLLLNVCKIVGAIIDEPDRRVSSFGAIVKTSQ